MSPSTRSETITTGVDDEGVGTVTRYGPPNNFLDLGSLRALADALAELDADPRCRVVILRSEGKHFCAGVNLADPVADGPAQPPGRAAEDFYGQALRLFDTTTPSIAVVQGAAIGGGLGLALACDFRVASPESRFSANFAQLGFHHGFGLSLTLPAVVGRQKALDLLYTGRRVGGADAAAMGLCDHLAPATELFATAYSVALDIASSAPLAVQAIRRTMRVGLLEQLPAAVTHEATEQGRLRETHDFGEGLSASGARRRPEFQGR